MSSMVYVNGSPTPHPFDSMQFAQSTSKYDEENDSAVGSTHSNSTHSPEVPGSREERFEDYGAAEEMEPELIDFDEKKSSLTKVPSFNRTASFRRSIRQRPSPASVRRTPSLGLGSGAKNSPASHRHMMDHDSGDPIDDDSNSVDSFQREEDIYHFTQQMEKLQNQVATLVQSQANQEDNVSKLRQDNAGLIERCTLLEEQLREQEMKYEERLREEHRKNMDLLQRLERDKASELENRNSRIAALESELSEMRTASVALQMQGEKYRLERNHCQDKLNDIEKNLHEATDENSRLKEAVRREREERMQLSNTHEQELGELRNEVESLRAWRTEHERHSSSVNQASNERVRELEMEIQRLRQENTQLEESNQELNLQIMNNHIAEGQSLLKNEMGSLFAEFSSNEMSATEAVAMYEEQREVNRKLKAYVDNLLISIMERAPQLLEVTSKRN